MAWFGLYLEKRKKDCIVHSTGWAVALLSPTHAYGFLPEDINPWFFIFLFFFCFCFGEVFNWLFGDFWM